MISRVGSIGVVLGLAMAGSLQANLFTGNGTDDLWTNVGNWSQGVVPINATSHPASGWDDPACPCYPLTADPADDGPLWNNDVKLQADNTITRIDGSVHAKAYGVRVGNGGANNVLEITGGLLDIGGVPPSGGDPVGWHLQVGRGYPGFDGGPMNVDPTATVRMSGGRINANGVLIPEQFVNNDLPDPTDSAPLNGELIMSGGSIGARWMNLGQLKGNGRAELSGDAAIYLWPNLAANRNNGGHLSFNRDWYLNGQPVPSTGDVSFDIRDDAALYLFGHMSDSAGVPSQVEVARYQTYVDDGLLTANGGTAQPIISLEPCPDDGSLDDYCVNAARMMITISAPEVEVTCDFDGSGDCDGADMDALVATIASGSHDVAFDLTGDDRVDVDDRDAWLTEAGALNLPSANPYLLGDANLDGNVDGQDFIAWNSNKFSTVAAWTAGDFTANGTIDGQDFIAWNSNKFSSADVVSVPEPAVWLWLLGLVGCFRKT